MGAVSRRLNRITLAAALAAGAFALAACDSAEDRLAKHVEGGRTLVEEGAFEKATLEFRNALEIDANSLAAHLGMAGIYEKQRNYPAMMAHLNKIIEIDPKNAEAQVKLGQMAMLSGQMEEALAKADAVIKDEPNNVGALVLKAGVSLRAGDSATALEYARRAIELEPDNTTAHAVLIGERLKEQDLPGALAIADDITKRVPTDLGVALVKVQVLEQMGDDDAVGAYLEVVVKQFPDQLALRTSLSRWHAKRGENDKAEEQLRAIAEASTENADASLRVVSFVLATKGAEAAREELTRLLGAREDKVPFEIALAELDYESDNPDAAKERLRRVIAEAVEAEAGADANRVRVVLARIFLRENTLEEARALVEEVLADDASNAAALGIRAALRYDDKDYTNALLDVRGALAAEPNNPQLLMLAGRTQLRAGNPDIAGENFSAAMQASQYDPAITMEFVNFLRLNNRADAVLTVLTEAARIQPRNEEILTALATEQLRIGDWAAADETAAMLAGVNEETSKRIRAATLSGREQYDESLSILNDIAQDPEQRDSALGAMIQVYFKAGKIDEAITHLDGVLAEEPRNVQALMLRAAVRLSQKDVDAAETDYQAAIAADPSAPNPYVALARIYFSQQRDEDALALLDAGLKVAVDPSGIRLFLGGYYETRQQIDDAIAQYRALYADQPNSLVAANNLASLLVEFKADDPQALQDAQEAAEALRGVEIPAFQDTYGWVQYQLGHYEEALRYLRPAAEALSDNPYVRYHLGLAYAKLGEGAEARPHLEAAAGAENFAFAKEAQAAIDALPAGQ
ncbi:MAG: tetratricopeptide repeat protein [Pikeienuella sp.]